MRKLFKAAYLGVTVLAFLHVELLWGQSEKSMSALDSYPFFFKVYSKDGRESLTASCSPTNLSAKPDEVRDIDCRFVNVRFSNPHDRIDKHDMYIPTTLHEAAEKDPSIRNEITKNPQKASEISRAYAKGMDQARQEMCSASSESKKRFQSQMTDPQTGPKRKKILQELLDSCQEKDPTVYIKRLTEIRRRSCDVWVDAFDLNFRKIDSRTWLFQSHKPGLLSNVLKTYELKTLRGSTLVTLTETRIPVSKGSERTPTEKPQQTVWSWDNFTEYEISCDFVTHERVQAP